MDKKLFEYVHEILAKQELVIVPNFGAFVLQKTTTFLNDGEYISIIFSAQQQNDDGVLKSYLQTEYNIPESEAEEFIDSSLEEIYQEINQSGLFKVEGIGEFRAINDRIVFKPFDEQKIIIYPKKETTPPFKAIETIEEVKKEPVKEIEEKVSDIEQIRREIEERKAAMASKQLEEEKKVEEKKVDEKIEEKKKEIVEEPKIVQKPKKKLEPIDYSKYRTAIIIGVLLIVLGGLAYTFRDALSDLSKPSITNDTSAVIMDKGMEQLADTLNEISNQDISNLDTNASSVNESNGTISSSESMTSATAESNTEDIKESNNSFIELNGNNTETLYYVTRGAYSSKKAAESETDNLNATGFEAKIIESRNSKKYNVVVGEFTSEAQANEELAFAKQIDNRFYLMKLNPKK